jgi:hypothetical protein
MYLLASLVHPALEVAFPSGKSHSAMGFPLRAEVQDAVPGSSDCSPSPPGFTAPPASTAAKPAQCLLELLDPRAAALNQNEQHHYKQNTCNNPDDCGLVHIGSSFPQC